MSNEQKEHKIQYILIGGIIILLIVNSMTFISKINNLENNVANISMGMNGSWQNQDISSMEARLLEEFKKGSSILTDSSSRLSAREGYFEVMVSVTPKEVRAEDKIFIALNDQKIQAKSINGVTYEAILPLKSLQALKPYVVIENGESSLQEVLPEIYMEEHIAIDISSISIAENDKKLRLDVAAITEESMQFITFLDDAEVVVVDDQLKEITRLKAASLETTEEVIDFGYKVRSYEVLFPDDLYEKDYFNAFIILKGNGVTLTSEQIYSYSKGGASLDSMSVTGFTISFDE